MSIAKYAIPIVTSFLGFMVDANVAFAGTITYDSLEVTNPQYISVFQVYGGASLPTPLVLQIGQITLQGAGNDLAVWCLDPIHEINSSGVYNITQSLPLTWTGAPLLTQDQVSQISSLMYNGNLVISGDVNASAAIQLAIWQVEYGPSFLFDTSADVVKLAATYISYVDGGIWSSSNNGSNLLTSLSDPNSQVVGYATPPAGPSPTPLPTSVILFGSVLGAAGYFGFRRRGTKFV